ncbi:23S rRNA pseudouridine(2604) synthase RluF [Candidatus Pacearchaeota archaeon]|nr:23S rRNA pseudouridine(2604) synthase RluF [Candidatus Pacearchaeota archaeon]
MVKVKRINKYISDSGLCSRREADKLVEAGKVLINGELAVTGSKVDAGDEVFVNGKLIEIKSERIYMAFNKPTGVTCTTDSKDPDNIIDFIGYNERIFPIGRLDKMSEGLIFLTNDGDIVNKILRAGNSHEKEYVVKIDKPVTEEFVKKMSNGVEILGTVTQKCQVEKKSNYSFRIVLTQGMNRQIRRMCEKLGCNVVKLKRVRIMNIKLHGILCGQWRYLSDDEMKGILEMVETSSGTEEMSVVEE